MGAAIGYAIDHPQGHEARRDRSRALQYADIGRSTAKPAYPTGRLPGDGGEGTALRAVDCSPRPVAGPRGCATGGALPVLAGNVRGGVAVSSGRGVVQTGSAVDGIALVGCFGSAGATQGIGPSGIGEGAEGIGTADSGTSGSGRGGRVVAAANPDFGFGVGLRECHADASEVAGLGVFR